MDKDKRSRIWEVHPLEFAADGWKLQVMLTSRIAAYLREEGVAAV